MPTSNFLLENATTERLHFRKLKPSDFEAWLPFHQDIRTSAHWKGLPQDPIEACKNQFHKTFERYEMGTRGFNALIEKSSGKLIGLCGLLVQNVDGVEELEIGYSILPEFWQKGFASEAALKCRDTAFANQWAKSLISIIHIDNHPSQKVAKNVGMHVDFSTNYKNNPVQIFRITHS
jgi:RimJ/RimL family protein N-acetyltransferase